MRDHSKHLFDIVRRRVMRRSSRVGLIHFPALSRPSPKARSDPYVIPLDPLSVSFLALVLLVSPRLPGPEHRRHHPAEVMSHRDQRDLPAIFVAVGDALEERPDRRV